MLSKWFEIQSIVVCVLFSLFLQACVTEQTGGQKKIIDRAKSLELHIQIALGNIDKGNRETARHHLTKAFEIDKNSAAATHAMAMLYQLEGEPVLAEQQFKLALKRDKNFTLARNYYGIFLFNQKRYTEAFAEFEIAAEDLAYSNRSQVLTNVGRSALKLDNEARAKAAFEHACILDRKNADAFIELADINFKNQEYAEAKRNIDINVSLVDHSPRSLVLSIRLDRIFGNKDKEASLALMLKSKFPYSKEYLEYKQSIAN